ncbi:MAG: nitroreductase [Actinophytocola sp.]|uniref:Acg family FMN-binding oxidoreductase n=1 Tax=Actinophytocola sp. TaxID=1872138 RepID=UPI003C796DA6
MTGWTAGEKNLIADAVAHAPSVHNTQPWVLEFHDPRQVTLYERLDRTLPTHDPLGRDRLISCGAALEHALLTVRVLGWTADLALYANPARPDEIGRLTVTGRDEPSEVDLRRFGAIAGRRSHRKPFAAPPTDDERRTLLAAKGVDGVGLRPVRGRDELAVLAKLLHHTALVLRADRAYQRELSAWTAPVRDPLPGTGVSAATRRVTTLPWAGLVRRTSAIPDTETLADRLRGELLLVVVTPDDGPHDHIRGGMAAAAVWLAATGAGLAGSILTQPFHLSEVRSGLVESLSLHGFPQLLLRFGQRTDQREESQR